jgi:hypothetical protein
MASWSLHLRIVLKGDGFRAGISQVLVRGYISLRRAERFDADSGDED